MEGSYSTKARRGSVEWWGKGYFDGRVIKYSMVCGVVKNGLLHNERVIKVIKVCGVRRNTIYSLVCGVGRKKVLMGRS